MEQLLHYCWKHKLLPLHELTTTDGKAVEVVHPGIHNTHAGPDFFNAKVRIDGTLWVGNVEIHDKAGDWYAHGHHQDTAYDNVVLHVCSVIDREVTRSDGQPIPHLQMDVPAEVAANYDELRSTDHYPPCYKVVPHLNQLMVTGWLAALQTERLEQKTADIVRRAERHNGDWEKACFITLARNHGFGTNGASFEAWAHHLSLAAAAKHRDNLLQVEALFLGQAGLLNPDKMTDKHRKAALADPYFQLLHNEYAFLAHKFSLTEAENCPWKYLRMRPHNFPHIRMARLAALYHSGKAGLSRLTECQSPAEAAEMYRAELSDYWQNHYLFGTPSARSTQGITDASLRLLLINTAIPTLFAYGRHTSKEALCRRAGEWLEQLRPEQNRVTKLWKDCGLTAAHAGESQALLQLRQNYCDRSECLRCRIGYVYLSARFNHTDG